MNRRVDHSGQVFGKLTVLCFSEFRNKRAYWTCKCACGVTKDIAACKLVIGDTKTCGCGRSKHGIRHGMNDTPEAMTFQNMKARTTNPNHISYGYYGARGIKVLYKSFEEFFNDVGPRPSKHHSIGRIDNNGHYAPGNCRWETNAEQSRNRRNVCLISWQDKQKTAKEWSSVVGIQPKTIAWRLRNGWDVESALTSPVQSRSK